MWPIDARTGSPQDTRSGQDNNPLYPFEEGQRTGIDIYSVEETKTESLTPVNNSFPYRDDRILIIMVPSLSMIHNSWKSHGPWHEVRTTRGRIGRSLLRHSDSFYCYPFLSKPVRCVTTPTSTPDRRTESDPYVSSCERPSRVFVVSSP